MSAWAMNEEVPVRSYNFFTSRVCWYRFQLLLPDFVANELTNKEQKIKHITDETKSKPFITILWVHVSGLQPFYNISFITCNACKIGPCWDNPLTVVLYRRPNYCSHPRFDAISKFHPLTFKNFKYPFMNLFMFKISVKIKNKTVV